MVKRVLLLWGSYVRYTDCKGYPTMQSFMRECPENVKRRHLPRLDDETMAVVDKLVRKLKQDNKQQFEMLFWRYVVQLEHKEVWRKLSLHPETYKKEIRLAERFVAGALAGSEIRLLV